MGEGKKERMVILGCGYLGRAVLEEALKKEYAVTVLTRNTETGKGLKTAYGVETVIADLAGEAWHGQIEAEGATVVLCVSSGGGGVEGYRHAYLGGTESISRWLKAGGKAKQIIYTGSTSVYPQTDGEWVDERMPAEGTTPLNEVLCGAEAAVKAMEAERLVERAYILRLAGIYGPGRHYLIDRLREGMTIFPGRGDYYLNLIHRDDAARAILKAAAAERTEGGIFNIADGQPSEKVAIAEWTAKALGVEVPVFDPEQVNERGRRRALNPGGIPNRRIRGEMAQKELGWKAEYANYREGYEAILREM